MVTPAILACPRCGTQHVERGKWTAFDHRKHLCYACGMSFEVPEANVGVASLKTP